jgi:protein-disulfide isomerase
VSKQNQIIIAIAAAIALGLAVLFGSGSSTQNAANDTNDTGNMSQSEAQSEGASDDAGASGAAAPSDLGPLETPNPLGEITLGDKNAPVTIVEYSSLTCPHCGAFHRDTLPTLKEKYIDKGLVRIHFRPFPFDPYATAGAMLAHCVAPKAQVTFLDILFKRQQQWLQSEQPMDVLQGFAKQGGLSETDFIICLKDQNRLDAIRQIQSTAAEELGVRSTPTFFINGKKLEGNVPLSEFEKLLKPALADFEGAQ